MRILGDKYEFIGPPISPFGSVMENRSFEGDTNSKYRFTFNGKETDFETDLQDYGMRIYSPHYGKFLSPDPLTIAYPWYTPYQFAGNRPIWAIDLDGLEDWMANVEANIKRQAQIKVFSQMQTLPTPPQNQNFTVEALFNIPFNVGKTKFNVELKGSPTDNSATATIQVLANPTVNIHKATVVPSKTNASKGVAVIPNVVNQPSSISEQSDVTSSYRPKPIYPMPLSSTKESSVDVGFVSKSQNTNSFVLYVPVPSGKPGVPSSTTLPMVMTTIKSEYNIGFVTYGTVENKMEGLTMSKYDRAGIGVKKGFKSFSIGVNFNTNYVPIKRP